MSSASNLYRLQQIDTKLDQVYARLQEIEKALNDNPELIAAQQIVQLSEIALNTHKKELKRIEEIVKNQRIKIEQTESMLYSGKVRNPKELQDLQNEVAALKRHISSLEDQQLESMLLVEEAENEHNKSSALLETTSAQVTVTQARLQGEKSTLKDQIERLAIERLAAGDAVSSQDMALYEQLRIQRRGIAVSRITDKTCSACGTTLTPALNQAAYSSNQIVRCTSCGRILYPG